MIWSASEGGDGYAPGRRPIWLSKLAVTAVYRDHGPQYLHQYDDVHPEAQRDIRSRY